MHALYVVIHQKKNLVMVPCFFHSKTPNPYNGFMPYILCPPLPCSAQLSSWLTTLFAHSAPALLASLLFLMSVPLPSKGFSSVWYSWNVQPIYLSISLTSFKSLLASHSLSETHPVHFYPQHKHKPQLSWCCLHCSTFFPIALLSSNILYILLKSFAQCPSTPCKLFISMNVGILYLKDMWMNELNEVNELIKQLNLICVSLFNA